MMPLCIQKPLDSNAGTTVYFPRMVTPSLTVSAAKLTEGTIVTPTSITDAQVSAVLEQYLT